MHDANGEVSYVSNNLPPNMTHIQPLSAPQIGYPDNNPKTAFGVKKVNFDAIPASALIELGAGMDNGRNKYGLYNYRDKTVSASVYYNAILRHLFAWKDGEDVAEDSGVTHLGHAMAGLAIIIDAKSLGKLNDDRGIVGAFSKIAKEREKK